MILGFIFWWPVGLALLFFGIWSKRMGYWGCAGRWGGWQQRQLDPATAGNKQSGPAAVGRVEKLLVWRPAAAGHLALQRQPGIRRISCRDASPAGGGAEGVLRASSSGCALPRTRRSSTSSWTNAATRPPAPSEPPPVSLRADVPPPRVRGGCRGRAVSVLPHRREPPGQHVEHRREQQPEQRHAEHPGEHRGAERLAHLGAGPGGDRQRHARRG